MNDKNDSDDKLSNARRKLREKYDSMTPEEQHKAGQAARQFLAEGKEGMYQFHVTLVRYALGAILLCVICLIIILFPDILQAIRNYFWTLSH